MIQCIIFKFRKWHTCTYEWYRLYRSYENCRRPGVAILDMQMSKVPIISGYGEIWKWSCLPSLLYCISLKTVDTAYTYYSWCMTSTDIVERRKNEWLWKFWKRNDLYENFEKRRVVEKRGDEEAKSMPHAPVGLSS